MARGVSLASEWSVKDDLRSTDVRLFTYGNAEGVLNYEIE